MTTTKMQDARHYIDKANMSARPEYYSARGPKRGDLGYRELVKFLELVKKDGGDEVAAAFVAMVAGIKSAAATTFLLGFYELEAQGWDWKGAPEHINREYDIGHSTHDQDQIVANGFATLIAAFGRTGGSGSEAAEDYACRGAFLEENGYGLKDEGGEQKVWRKLKKGERPQRPALRYGF